MIYANEISKSPDLLHTNDIRRIAKRKAQLEQECNQNVPAKRPKTQLEAKEEEILLRFHPLGFRPDKSLQAKTAEMDVPERYRIGSGHHRDYMKNMMKQPTEEELNWVAEFLSDESSDDNNEEAITLEQAKWNALREKFTSGYYLGQQDESESDWSWIE